MEDKMAEVLHEVDFKVPLSGSELFDIHTFVTAKNICTKFPGLDYEIKKDHVRIHGSLNDYWYQEWLKYLFNANN
ncbi:MAG: hypothetical protein IIY96_05215 [Lachnospiraceae bacterium]|nr:hypothetical protein [Lachnospiraceae bacterium]